MTTATATNLDGSEPDEVMVAEELAAAAKLDAEFDGTEAAAAAVDEHNTIATDTAPTIDVVRAGIRSLLIAWDGVEAVHGHGYYEAQIDTVSNFASPDDFYKGKATFTVFDGLTTGVVYYARVRAVDAAGNTGPWSTSTGAQTSDETGTGDIADDAVTTVKIDDLAVTTAKIGNLAVDTAKIASAAITTAKIDSLAVSTAKIQDAAVETLKINGLAVTVEKISDPIDAPTNYDSASGVALGTSHTTVTSGSIAVPSWAGSVSILNIGAISCIKTSSGGSAVGLKVGVGGTYSNELPFGVPGGSISSQTPASANFGRTISAPGSSVTVDTTARGGVTGIDAQGFQSALGVVER